MGKLWTFGDSFTLGAGLAQETGYEFVWYGLQFKDYVYPNILAHHYGLSLGNYGKSGEGNQTIINTTVRNLPNINSQDVVIIGLSCSQRMNIPTKDGGNFVSSGDILDKIIKAKKSVEGVHPWSKQLVDTYTDEELQTIYDYYLTQYPRFSDLAYSEYIMTAQALQHSLLQRGVKCLVFDRSIWDNFENITEWTKGLGDQKVEDGHWSPNGHLAVAEVLKRAMKDVSVDNLILVNNDHVEFELERNPKLLNLQPVYPTLPVTPFSEYPITLI